MRSVAAMHLIECVRVCRDGCNQKEAVHAHMCELQLELE
jgi:hypothetical protein